MFVSLYIGSLTGHKVAGVRMVLEDGVSHIVDSSELAFKAAGRGAMRTYFPQADPIVLEPVMAVEAVVPQEFQVRDSQEYKIHFYDLPCQGVVIGGLNKRRAVITDTNATVDYFTVYAEVRDPLMIA